MDLAARTCAIGAALAEHGDLPQAYLSVGETFAYIGMPTASYRDRFSAIREVAAWAKAFETEMIVSLSYGGSGKVETTVELGGIPVAAEASVGTARAYDLGRILQRELTRDVSIHIGADELLAAIDQVVAP